MPVEQGSRNYRGPEAQAVPAPPPMPAPMRPPAMPPAEELDPMLTQPVVVGHDDLVDAFYAWLKDTPVEPGFESKLFEAFKAGVAWHAQRGMRSARAQAPLEGTVESRTIVAALAYFRDQVLAHRPEEVATGEWLNATDVGFLIQAIQRKGSF